METIRRDPASAAKERFDAIVVGGGIYGVMLACEGSRRGLKLFLSRRTISGKRRHERKQPPDHPRRLPIPPDP